jgi:hypothetical protein
VIIIGIPSMEQLVIIGITDNNQYIKNSVIRICSLFPTESSVQEERKMIRNVKNVPDHNWLFL